MFGIGPLELLIVSIVGLFTLTVIAGLGYVVYTAFRSNSVKSNDE